MTRVAFSSYALVALRARRVGEMRQTKAKNKGSINHKTEPYHLALDKVHQRLELNDIVFANQSQHLDTGSEQTIQQSQTIRNHQLPLPTQNEMPACTVSFLASYPTDRRQTSSLYKHLHMGLFQRLLELGWLNCGRRLGD